MLLDTGSALTTHVMTAEADSGAPAVGKPPMASPDPLMLRRTLVAGVVLAADSERSAAALRRVALMVLVTCSW